MATSKDFDLYIDGLNEVLRGLSRLPKEAQNELKTASMNIAAEDMAPAWRNAATYYAGPWGPRIAASVRVKKDRLPAVSIGYAKRVFSGGASSIMVRYPTDKGDRGRSAATMPAPFAHGFDWISARRNYGPSAIRKWADAVEQVVAKWSHL